MWDVFHHMNIIFLYISTSLVDYPQMARLQRVGGTGILHQAGLVRESARQQQGIHRLRQGSEAVVSQGACVSGKILDRCVLRLFCDLE